jgi:hypothetical protein
MFRHLRNWLIGIVVAVSLCFAVPSLQAQVWYYQYPTPAYGYGGVPYYYNYSYRPYWQPQQRLYYPGGVYVQPHATYYGPYMYWR